MRPSHHLNAASKLYPNAWVQVEEMRQDKGKGLPDWPAWCFLPMAGYYAIVSSDAGVNALGLDLIGDVAKLAAVGTWRYTQGIYRFDDEVYQTIAGTVAKGDMPVEVLYRLPEWCVYVETPGIENQYGFFAHLERDINTGRDELRILLDEEEKLYPVILHMGDWTVTEAVDRAISEGAKQGQFNKMHWPVDDMVMQLSAIAHQCISLLLYLCSDEPDIERVENELPQRAKPTKTKKGWRLFPPAKPKIWNVGREVAQQLQKIPKAPTEATKNSPVPHIRRAHWHGYWTGKTGTNERKFIYKWLPPMVINSIN